MGKVAGTDPSGAPPSPEGPEEPLGVLARFAYDFAPHLCDPAHGCRDYHRAWSMLRLYESGGALPRGQAFFGRELADLARRLDRRRLRILVSGAADTGQVAMLLGALHRQGITPDFVIVDLCRTSLAQQDLYLRMQGMSATIIQGDAVTVTADPVDAVISHSFIGFVPPETRAALFANWARLLRSGGRLLAVERFAPEPGFQQAWPDPQERAARRARLATRLQADGLSAADVQGYLAAADRLWDMTGKRHRMGSAQFDEMIAAAGLRLLRRTDDTSGESVSPIAARAATAVRPSTEAVAERP